MAEWPDEVYEKAKAWSQWLIGSYSYRMLSPHSKLLFDAVREEEARREVAQVCGAKAPFTFAGQERVCETKHQQGDLHIFWYGGDPVTWECSPECDRPHLTEAAERVIEAARNAFFRHSAECGGLSNASCICGSEELGRAIIAHDREADRA